MTLYQVRKIVGADGIPRYGVIAVDDNGSERPLMEFDSEAEAKASARAAVLWWDRPQPMKPVKKHRPFTQP
jgi:hypothetical protein